MTAELGSRRRAAVAMSAAACRTWGPSQRPTRGVAQGQTERQGPQSKREHIVASRDAAGAVPVGTLSIEAPSMLFRLTLALAPCGRSARRT